jgi:5-hydroxyisourate hydrolase
MADRAPVTTHILDLVRGKPANGIGVRLFSETGEVAQGVTDKDGRVDFWQQPFEILPGRYRLEFDVEPWFSSRGEDSFYEDVQISFRVRDTNEHYHVPLLLSPFGYSTYRGS